MTYIVAFDMTQFYMCVYFLGSPLIKAILYCACIYTINQISVKWQLAWNIFRRKMLYIILRENNNWARKLERMLGESDNHDFSSWLGNYILKMRYQNICVLIQRFSFMQYAMKLIYFFSMLIVGNIM